MMSSLRRLYLYVVASAALIFTSYAVEQFIQSLLYRSLNWPYTYVTYGGPEPRQALALLLVAIIIAVPIGAVHWWLIRREGKTDPTARANGVRAFFLSGLLISYASVAISRAVSFLDSLGQQQAYFGSSGGPAVQYPPFSFDALAFLITALLALAALLVERRWTRPEAESEAARNVTAVLFGLSQIGWLISALISVADLVQSALDRLIQLYPTCQFGVLGSGSEAQLCQYTPSDLRYAIFWVAGNIVGLILFLWLPRRVRATIVQQVVGGMLAFTALIFAIVGIQRLVIDLLAYIGGTGNFQYFGFGAGLVDTSIYYYGYTNTKFLPATFIGPIVAGLLGSAFVWLWFTWRTGPSERAARGRAVYLFGLQLPLAYCLVAGLGGVIQFVLLLLLHGNGAIDGGWLESFYGGVGLLVCDLAWPWLIYRLYRLGHGAESGAHQTWRIYLALVTSLSAVAALIGTAIAAYALFSTVAGTPLNNGLSTGTQGAGIAVAGLVVAIVHAVLWRRDHLAHQAQQAAAPAVPATGTVASGGEDTLDAVLARVANGSLSADAAGQLIRSRYHLD